MVRLSVRIGLVLIVLVLTGGITSLQAIPVCTSTIVLPGGIGSVFDTALSPGVCVQSQDKLFGNFNLGNLPDQAAGTVVFGFTTIGTTDRHTITFTNPFMPGNTYDNSFEVEVLEGGGFPTSNFITSLSADFTQSEGGPSTLTQTTTPAGTGSIALTKTGNVPTGPFQISYAPGLTDLTINSSFTTGPGSDASAILNTIVEQVSAPEPNSVVLLGLALTTFGAVGLRRKPRR